MAPNVNPRLARGGARHAVLLLGVGWMVACALVLAIWVAAKPVGGTAFIAVEDGIRTVGPLGLLPLCVPRLKRQARDGAGRVAHVWVPLLMGLAVLGFVAGRGILAWNDIIRHQTTGILSAADLGFLASYPFLFAAILLLPSRSTLAARMRVLLDALLILLGAIAFSWYFILGPTILQFNAPLTEKLVTGAYPLWDLLLFACWLMLCTLFRDAVMRRFAVILSIGLLALVTADSIREYRILHGLAGESSLLDMARPVAFMILGIVGGTARTLSPAAVEAPGAGPHHPRRGHTGIPQLWRYLLPYVSVPAVVALMIYVARTPGDPRLASGVYLCGALLIELVFVHQFLDYRELIAFANRTARLENLAAACPVTGLPNHRTIVSALDMEIMRSRRYNHPCAILFLDLDHFKTLNDSYGHPTGDAALREFASVVRTALRAADMLGRWGGEEFVALLPETDNDTAIAVAERVREAVASHIFWAAGGARVTCSIGVAAVPEDADTRDALVEKADQAMYAAKRLGRNQVLAARVDSVA